MNSNYFDNLESYVLFKTTRGSKEPIYLVRIYSGKNHLMMVVDPRNEKTIIFERSYQGCVISDEPATEEGSENIFFDLDEDNALRQECRFCHAMTLLSEQDAPQDLIEMHVDGIIGFDILQYFLIDFQNGRIMF